MRLFDYLRTLDSSWFEMPVIVADEIVSQIDALPLPNSYTPQAEEYGIVAPPFRAFFIQARSRHPDGRRIERGVFCEDISEPTLAGEIQTRQAGDIPEQTRWVLKMHGFMLVDGKMLVSYPSAMYFHMDSEGHLLDDMNEVNIAIETVRELRDPRYLDPVDLASHAPYALKAISAMHKRVEVEQVTPTRQQRRQYERKHDVKLLDYYVLKVKPTKPATDFEGVGQPGRAKAREHIVRGHFRYYHPDRPGLGGRLVGAVWIPEHERGDQIIGKIRKDYEVSADQDE